VAFLHFRFRFGFLAVATPEFGPASRSVNAAPEFASDITATFDRLVDGQGWAASLALERSRASREPLSDRERAHDRTRNQ
jgi:hypothetical protein